MATVADSRGVENSWKNAQKGTYITAIKMYFNRYK
jgi:hypothetical protein